MYLTWVVRQIESYFYYCHSSSYSSFCTSCCTCFYNCQHHRHHVMMMRILYLDSAWSSQRILYVLVMQCSMLLLLRLVTTKPRIKNLPFRKKASSVWNPNYFALSLSLLFRSIVVEVVATQEYSISRSRCQYSYVMPGMSVDSINSANEKCKGHPRAKPRNN